MKYELRATARVFLPLYGALLIVSILNRIFTYFDFSMPSSISTVIFAMMIAAIFVITFVLTLQRFRKNLLSSEGYLMFTLPVGTDSLILSKLLISALWFLLSGIVVLISLAIMFLNSLDLRAVADGINELIIRVNIGSLHLSLYVIEALAGFILSYFSGILMLYSCLAVSLLFNKHRGLAAFGAFIGFSIIGQWIGGICMLIADYFDFFRFYDNLSSTAMVHAGLWTIILANAVMACAFYMLTRYMLKNRLNLE